MEQEFRAFLDEHVAQARPLQQQLNLAYWSMATTGEQEYITATEQFNAALMRLLAKPGAWAQLQHWYAQRHTLSDPQLRRQLELLHHLYASNQHSPEQIERIAALEAEVTGLFTTFRGTMHGTPVADNDIRQILRHGRDTAERQAAWEASKQIGALAAPIIQQLIALRNQSAQAMGWSDYYAMALELQEIDEAELFALLDTLEAETRAPFQQLKAQFDAVLADRFGITPAELRPWHYSDPFFQESPNTGTVDLDTIFADQDIAALTLRTLDGMGLDGRDILDRSDLYERAGKHQHAFCIHMDPLSDDVRILANLRPEASSMETSLHEFGHAIYDKYLQPDLPFMLRSFAHISTTEAIAMLMGRLVRDAAWLEQVRGLSSDQAQALADPAFAEERTRQLVFVRWGLVMVYFERDLYRAPSDLNSRWWDYVERFQGVTRPEGRDAPDWAAKVHFATNPVYYHNYILGELTASQLIHAISKETGHSVVENRAAGTLLRDRLFALGAILPWNEALLQVTGERLHPRYFVRDFVSPQR